jgi:hypothetical protein
MVPSDAVDEWATASRDGGGLSDRELIAAINAGDAGQMGL